MLECRAEQGRKLRSMYRCLGWSRADCAKFLHVSERCLHNWEAGRHPVPYAAYRLLRIHCGMALPGREWRGWSISRGKALLDLLGDPWRAIAQSMHSMTGATKT